MRHLIAALSLVATTAWSLEPATEPAAPPEQTPPLAQPSPPKAPYSLPWQLRPLAPVRVIRLDDSLDFASTGTTNVLIVNAAWSFHPRIYLLARLGGTYNDPVTGSSAVALSNLLIGGTYLQPLGDFRLGLFLGVTAPIASGGGNTPDAAAKVANATAMLARSSMDNAVFAVNDFTLVPGIGLAWVRSGLTVQLEATVLELFRVRGEAVQADTAKTNFTSGLHVGYFLVPQLSLGAELRYQRWLTTPAAVAKDESLRDNLNFAVGARVHLKAGSLMLRPGVSFSHGIVGTMVPAGHSVIQFDIPVAFP